MAKNEWKIFQVLCGHEDKSISLARWIGNGRGISDEWMTLPGWADFELQIVVFGNGIVCFVNSKETGITSWLQ